DDPTSRYVLIAEARALATEAADFATLREALRQLLDEFEVDATTTRLDAWNALVKRPRVDTATMQQLANEATSLFDQATVDAKFDDGKRYGEFALAVTRRLPNAAAGAKLITEKNAALAARQKEWPALAALAEKLKTAPDDAEANLALARYLALAAEDWPAAFPRYAKSGDETLAGLGAKSVKALENTAAQSAAGDAWWDAAQAALNIDLSAVPAGGAMPNRTFGEPATTSTNSTSNPTTNPTTNSSTNSNTNNSGSTGANVPRGNAPAPAAGDQRQIAAYYQALGGMVTVRAPGTNSYQQLLSTQRLPDGPFSLTTVTLNDLKNVGDNELLPLRGLPELQILVLNNTSVSSRGLAALKGLPIARLQLLRHAQFTDEIAPYLVALPNLSTLEIRYCSFTDAGLAQLKDCKKLGNLELSGSPVTGAGFSQFPDDCKIGSLMLANTPFDDVGMANVTRFREIYLLDVLGTKVTDRGTRNIQNLERMVTLRLSGTNTSDVTLRLLEKMPKLTRIDVGLGATPEGVQSLRNALPKCNVPNP
ncbi:MAG: hypothetical protein K8U03_14415, partial [Planctomycetia bacterium]|nr:hypothetical protein [Planctomycetia bacterium]